MIFAQRRGIGLLGGTFDPVHNGHLALARTALAALPVWRIELLPAGNPWQKKGISPAHHRLNMLRDALEYESDLLVNTRELTQDGPSYTVQTLKSLREQVGTAMPLTLILGSDQWNNLPTWHDWQSLTDYAHLAICRRDGSPIETPPELEAFMKPHYCALEYLSQKPAGGVTFFDMAPHEASATKIRRTLSNMPFDQAMKKLDDWLPVSVSRYIREHKLYGIQI